ncbi:redoxin domain-containing protein [Brevibacterium sp. 50QC2O2]|uniref:redoxin domain-containing protein n=1 Tax=Brevibacterium TaxID=1696 RepID=UPI00211C8E5E|nr:MULTISPECIES: redoxin domain-containing protein [unclassified Brevibacterium]MCQ9366636.1 redoxin domain-containing protein [Brevibacterium sp. 91QC2O2]MCQ9384482.1 redoxin domain-containing protein [Brevibacterium sp. 68QC2CO]MCQ9389624.1 redoxin domain-containing protein [Brevibacterium sp. 50QC2O2]
MNGAAPVPGVPAPELILPDQYGSTFVLSEASRESAVLLVFYPFAFSPVCGREMSLLTDLARTGEPGGGIRAVGISVDSKYTLAAWSREAGIGIELLSDFWPHGAAAQTYGVFDEQRGAARRGTFLIDTHGIIQRAETGPVDRVRDLASWLH